MYFPLLRAVLILFVFLQSSTGKGQIRLTAGMLHLDFDNKGYIIGLSTTTFQQELLAKDTSAPIMTLVSGTKHYLPTSAKYSKGSQLITLSFLPSPVKLTLKVVPKKSYFVLELVAAQPASEIDGVIWGPFPTVIHETVGEVIGVVRDQQVALGLQVLNVKTLGGDFPNREGSSWARGIAAVARGNYSLLQAYSINRDRPRRVDAWGGEFANMPVAPIKGETVVGSKVALFACNAAATLDQLEQIALTEQLPFPTYKKQWFKKSPLFGKSYLISSFGEKEVDEMIGYTKRAGLISLYHEGPFKSWGHYILDPVAFPNGTTGLKNCVDKAHAAGLFFGVHTLTNFINTDDPYVSPVPDDRLSLTGAAPLAADIDASQKEMEVSSPEYFNQEKNNNLHTVKIGKELIRYKSVTAAAPYKLIDCQRGAFGTTPAAHSKGERVGKLFDHAYQVFFPNIELQREIARNLAHLFNSTGVDHFDLDGHEGCLASGEGDYGIELFAKDVYDNLDHEYLMGTSNSKTFFWNIGSYYNWGEPWYGGFKESMQQYRIDNQGLFERNFMPHMLGWYLLGESTTMAEMEWMLARAAGYSAGFAMVARPKALRSNPLTPQLLDVIREWETARTTGAFSSAQQEQLKNPKNEFHLEKRSEGKWNLYQYFLSPVFTHEKMEKQPGEPTYSRWTYKQESVPQTLQFRVFINGKNGGVRSIRMLIDNYAELQLPIELAAGESIVCDGSQEIRIYNASGKPRGSFHLKESLLQMAPATHTIIFNADFQGDETPKVELQFRFLGKVESVSSRK